MSAVRASQTAPGNGGEKHGPKRSDSGGCVAELQSDRLGRLWHKCRRECPRGGRRPCHVSAVSGGGGSHLWAHTAHRALFWVPGGKAWNQASVASIGGRVGCHGLYGRDLCGDAPERLKGRQLRQRARACNIHHVAATSRNRSNHVEKSEETGGKGMHAAPVDLSHEND